MLTLFLYVQKFNAHDSHYTTMVEKKGDESNVEEVKYLHAEKHICEQQEREYGGWS